MIDREIEVDGPFLSCLLNCCSVKLAEMGVDDSLWLPVTIDMRQITSMKASAEHDGQEFGTCTSIQLHNGDFMLVNVPYTKAISDWKYAVK